MQRGILPLDAVNDSVEMYLGLTRTGAGRVYRVVLLAIAATVAALPIIRVEVSATGSGFIRPELEKHDITTPVGGTVSRLAVHRGQDVRQGDTLLVIGSPQLLARASAVRAEIADHVRDSLDLARLTSLAAGASSVEPVGDRYAQSLARLVSEQNSYELRIEAARVEWERSRALLSRELVAKAEVEALATDLNALRADAGLARERYLADWEDARDATERELERLRLELTQIVGDLEQHVIRSPVDGTLEELASVSEGSNLPAGSRIAVVSPSTGLVGEILVSPGDIGSIDTGMPVRLAVDAFDYREWGFISGLVSDLSRDFVLVEDQPYFRARIALSTTSLRQPAGPIGELRKGMSVSARFRIAERSVWNLIWDTSADWLNPYERSTRLAD